MNRRAQEPRIRPRVLLVNANSSAAVTSHLTALARACAPHIEFIPITPAFGPTYILNPAQVAIAAHAVLDAVKTHLDTAAEEPDACLVACFGEVGLSALRHRFDFPVLNMAEAGIITAMQLGTRYGILALGDHWPAMLHEMVRLYGFEARYVGAYRLPGEPLDLMADPDGARNAIAALVAAIPAGTVDVLVMGGAALTGLARQVQPAVAVPLVDCLYASIAQMEAAIVYDRLAAIRAAV